MRSLALPAALALLSLASAAQAHPKLVVASPAPNATVAKPARVALQFSEKLMPKFSGADLMMTGHGAMDEGATGWVHLLADILHLLAAGAWVGALLGLTLLVVRPAARVDVAHLRLTHRALHGFGMVGTIVVGTIVVTGLVNGWLLVGASNLPRLPTSLYGQLLLAKLALFGAMLGLASLNRFRLTPAFERSVAARDHRAALGALRRSLAIEASCAVTILALVAWLGMLEPPATAM